MKGCLDRKNLLLSSTDGMATMRIGAEHELLEAFVDFLYTGSLPREKLQKLVTQLFVLGYMYEIEYLREVCLHHMLVSLQSSNAFDFQSSTALDFLRIGYLYEIDELMEAALDFTVKNLEEVVFSDEYEKFASKFPQLCVQITRRSLINANRRLTEV